MWWRTFIPSWRFFDAVGIQPELFVFYEGGWHLAIHRPRLKWYSLLFNPDYNRYHACNNLVERLILEMMDPSAATRLVSYRLVEDLARDFVQKKLLASSDSKFSFRVVVQGQEVLRSAELPLQVAS
jgi:hypothetical protein